LDNSGITKRDGELFKELRIGPEHVVVGVLGSSCAFENGKTFAFLLEEFLSINIKKSSIFWCLRLLILELLIPNIESLPHSLSHLISSNIVSIAIFILSISQSSLFEGLNACLIGIIINIVFQWDRFNISPVSVFTEIFPECVILKIL
jgi:hypothetical protein